MVRLLPALLAAIMALGLHGQAAAQAPESGYRFSPVNQFDIKLMAAYWNPIVQYVSARSGVKLQLKIGRTSADTTAYVLTQEVEFIFSNHLFSPEREKLGWKVFGRRNTPAIHGEVVVPEDSPITELAQLRGLEVAFPGPEAFIAYKVPYAALLNAGVDVHVVFGGNQNAALAQLFAGKVKAAGGNSQLIEAYARREHHAVRVIWRSEPYHDLALMVSSRVPDRDAQAVAQAFLGMDKDPVGMTILRQADASVGVTDPIAFIPATAADYDAYRHFYQTAPVQLR